MVVEHRGDHVSQWAAIVSIAAKIWCTALTLHNWVAQTARDNYHAHDARRRRRCALRFGECSMRTSRATASKVWRQQVREGEDVARTHGDPADARNELAERHSRKTREDDDRRQGRAMPVGPGEPPVPAPRPNVLWVSDFTTYSPPGRASSTWRSSSTPMLTALSAGGSAARLTPASFSTPWSRRFTRPASGSGLVHYSGRGAQGGSIKYTERLAEAGLEPSVGSVGDSYDNALAETIDGLYKAEVIYRCGPWRFMEAVEYATLDGSVQQLLLNPSAAYRPPRPKTACSAEIQEQAEQPSWS